MNLSKVTCLPSTGPELPHLMPHPAGPSGVPSVTSSGFPPSVEACVPSQFFPPHHPYLWASSVLFPTDLTNTGRGCFWPWFVSSDNVAGVNVLFCDIEGHYFGSSPNLCRMYLCSSSVNRELFICIQEIRIHY
jgi:hypothetical protein